MCCLNSEGDGMCWKAIEKLRDDDKIGCGALIRFYDTDKAVAEGVGLLVEPMDYILSPIYGNSEYFQLVCLSAGEEGNIVCVLKCQGRYTLGAEIKRMLVSGWYEVFINIEPKIIVD